MGQGVWKRTRRGTSCKDRFLGGWRGVAAAVRSIAITVVMLLPACRHHAARRQAKRAARPGTATRRRPRPSGTAGCGSHARGKGGVGSGRGALPRRIRRHPRPALARRPSHHNARQACSEGRAREVVTSMSAAVFRAAAIKGAPTAAVSPIGMGMGGPTAMARASLLLLWLTIVAVSPARGAGARLRSFSKS